MRRVTGILLSIIILASLAASSCDQNSYDPGIDVDEVVANSLAAQSTAGTCRFDMFQVVYTYGQQGILMQEYTVSDNAVGVLDQANHKMEADMTVTVAETGRDLQTTQLRLFLVGDCLYTGTLSSGQQWTWQKQALSPGSWDTQQALGQQLQLLESSQRKIVRDEVVNGVDCYVLELTPDVDQFWDTMAGSLPGEMTDAADPEAVVTGLSFTQWIARDTFMLAKGMGQINLHLTEQDMDTVALVEIQFDNYNLPVSISLPPEAED